MIVEPVVPWPAGAPAPRALGEFVAQLADRARSLILPHVHQRPPVDYKADDSPVTAVDRAVERELRQMIRARYPDHGQVGEEFGQASGMGEGTQTLSWIIDPIDGTKAFVTGRPEFGTLIGLLHDGVPILGLIDAPLLDKRWLGVRGHPTWLNLAPVRTGEVTQLGDAMLGATTIDMFDVGERAAFDALGEQVRLRVFGGDCCSYGLLASGRLDLVVEASLHPYDYLPVVPVVEQAGGVITDWDGRRLELGTATGRVLAAANPVLHAAARDALAG